VKLEVISHARFLRLRFSIKHQTIHSSLRRNTTHLTPTGSMLHPRIIRKLANSNKPGMAFKEENATRPLLGQDGEEPGYWAHAVYENPSPEEPAIATLVDRLCTPFDRTSSAASLPCGNRKTILMDYASLRQWGARFKMWRLCWHRQPDPR
jgi:hypothetical protein